MAETAEYLAGNSLPSLIRSKRTLGVILVLISALVFSSAGLFVKGVEADAWTILFWRGLSAALFTAIYVVRRGQTRQEFLHMGYSGLCGFWKS